MPDRFWDRAAGVAGVAFALVLFASTFIGGVVPAPSRSAATIVRHYVDNRGALLFQAWLGGVAAGILFPPFLVGLARVTSQPEGEAGPAGALMLIAGTL